MEGTGDSVGIKERIWKKGRMKSTRDRNQKRGMEKKESMTGKRNP